LVRVRNVDAVVVDVRNEVTIGIEKNSRCKIPELVGVPAYHVAAREPAREMGTAACLELAIRGDARRMRSGLGGVAADHPGFGAAKRIGETDLSVTDE
jgi:hypothetical protein